MVPVSSIAGTANLWVWMDKYNRPRCIYTLLILDCQPSLLTLSPPAASVSLLFLNIHAGITELGLFIIRWWLLVRSSFVMLWFMWCFRIIPGNMSCLPAIITHQSLLLTSAL